MQMRPLSSVMDGIPEEILGLGQRNVRLFNGLSEKEPEIWTDGSEVLGWREGEVELQTTG